GRQLDLLRGEPGAHRALDLVIAGRVDVEPEIAEHFEDAAARIGLHRVAKREPERRGELERAARGRLEAGAIVAVARRAEAGAPLCGLRKSQGLTGHARSLAE